MKCSRCRGVILKSDFAKAHIERDEDGRIVRILHNKCWLIEKREHSGLYQDRAETPTAYDERARYRNADDL